MDEIRILQLGEEDFREKYQLPANTDFYYENIDTSKKAKLYDLVLLARTPDTEELEALQRLTKAYTLFVVEGTVLSQEAETYFLCRKGRYLAKDRIQEFLTGEVRNFFPKPYGEKFSFHNFAVSQEFSGKVTWSGNYKVTLTGDLGSHMHQAAYWRNTIPVFSGQAIDLWLEYKKSPEIQIAMKITQFRAGSLAEIQQIWEFSEEDMKEPVTIDNQKQDGSIFVSIYACGQGSLEIIGLHDRYSRRGQGYFLPGGERAVTSDREEVFFYFDPGDRKPPLNVYFSGYKTMEGFEGYYLMRKLGSPFLLISEARLEGGCFYMGSAEYEKKIVAVLQKYREELGFTQDQVILSGLSMGTFGAMYYGCDVRPHTILLGKPLANIGDVAANERLHRPGGFPTSLDVLKYLYKGMEPENIEALNRRFWDKFDRTDWSRSRFVASYMIEDDYDQAAYTTLLSHLQSDGVQVYGKGIHGRHNDDTNAIVKWFVKQYEKILAEDFGRRREEK